MVSCWIRLKLPPIPPGVDVPDMPGVMVDRLRCCTAWAGPPGRIGPVTDPEVMAAWRPAWALTRRVILAAIEAQAFDWDEFAVTRWKKAEFVRARAILTPILRCFMANRPRHGAGEAISFPAIAALSGRPSHSSAVTQYIKWQRRGEVQAAAMTVASRLAVPGLELALHRMAVGAK